MKPPPPPCVCACAFEAHDSAGTSPTLRCLRCRCERYQPARSRLTDETPPGFSGSGPVLVPLHAVKPRPVEWLWAGRIPKGKVTVLDGDPGLGKSTLTLDVAARVSTGRAMPDGAPGLSGGVVILSAEDDLADTIRPRLEAAGADLRRVLALTAVRCEGAERLPELPGDLERLQEAIARCQAALVVIDPLVAYLAPEVNAHRDQDVRRALAPVAWVAHRTGAAVLVVRHLTKGAGGSNAVRRGGGSIGIIGAARSGLLVAADPDDEERRVLAPTKANLARLAPSLLYRIVPAGEHASAVEWLGETPFRADDLLAEADRREHRGAMEEAIDFLRQALAEGPIPSRTVWKQSEAAGITRITLRRAKERLGVRHVREGFGPGSSVRWELPASHGVAEAP